MRRRTEGGRMQGGGEITASSVSSGEWSFMLILLLNHPFLSLRMKTRESFFFEAEQVTLNR